MTGPPDPRPQRTAPPPPSLRIPRPRRRTWGAAALSVLAHGGVVALALWPARVLFDQGGGGGPGPRGGGGGGGRSVSAVIALEAYAAPAETPAPEAEMPVPPVAPVPTPAIVPLDDVTRIDLPAEALTSAVAGAGAGTGGGPGTGTGTGGGRGSGTGTGVGADAGPGSGGDGRYIVRPTPRGVILPPECAKGEYLATFWVAADGRVTNVEIQPPAREASCRREFEGRMRGYRFEPAKSRDGRPVASMFEISISR